MLCSYICLFLFINFNYHFQAECYHYLFDAAIKLHQLGLDAATPDHGPIRRTIHSQIKDSQYEREWPRVKSDCCLLSYISRSLNLLITYLVACSDGLSSTLKEQLRPLLSSQMFSFLMLVKTLEST